jgi:hypothetical protein
METSHGTVLIIVSSCCCSAAAGMGRAVEVICEQRACAHASTIGQVIDLSAQIFVIAFIPGIIDAR